jgi:Zinc carboxypeptidase/Thrombospondin type 3 repeat
MKKLLVIAALLICASFADAREYYFRIDNLTRTDVESLSKIVDIDNVKGGSLFGFVNSQAKLDLVRSLGFAVTELALPNSLVKPDMAASKAAWSWNVYPTYGTYLTMMDSFAVQYPSLCVIETIGVSVQGRLLLAAKISDNVNVQEDEPEMFYTSSMHGDETTGYVLMLRLIDSLLNTYGTDTGVTNFVNSVELYINPLANPDGTYQGGNSTVAGAMRYNANGVDLNRNFPDPDEGDHPDGNPWQPETIAMMNFASLHSIVLSANFHGGAEVVNYPWDTYFVRHPDDTWLQQLSRIYADSCHAHSPAGYMSDLFNGITNGWDWYPVAGGRQDYMTFWMGARETTIEISNVKLMPAAQLPNFWVYNRAALFAYLRQALTGIRGIVTDSITGAPLAATIKILGHDIDSSEVFTDPDVGDYHRMIANGTWNLQCISPGYVSKTINGIVVGSGNASVVNVLLAPVDTDLDDDGIPDSLDNCPSMANLSQADMDADSVGDICDNCPNFANPSQIDIINDGIGDACQFVCGDCDNSGHVNIVDVTFMVRFAFFGGSPPVNYWTCDTNGNGTFNIVDLTTLVMYLFSGGSVPLCQL